MIRVSVSQLIPCKFACKSLFTIRPIKQQMLHRVRCLHNNLAFLHDIGLTVKNHINNSKFMFVLYFNI